VSQQEDQERQGNLADNSEIEMQTPKSPSMMTGFLPIRLHRQLEARHAVKLEISTYSESLAQ
jgi:hypothetical protein